MKSLLFTCALFVFPASHAYLQQTYQKLFGNASQDNRCQAIEKLPDSAFVLAGDWTGRGYLMTVDHSGVLLKFLSLEGLIAGSSSINQVLADADGNLLAAGRELWVQTALSGATCLLPQNLNPGAYLVAVQNRRRGTVKTLRWMAL